MKNKAKIIIAILFVGCVYIWCVLFSNSIAGIEFHNEVYNESKKYQVYYKRDSIIDEGRVIDLSGIKSDYYQFAYTMNTGKYDSVFYLGEYPLPTQVKKIKPELYDAYNKFYNDILYNLNSYSVFMNKAHYIAFATYKNNNVHFLKIKTTSTNLRISPSFIMLRNKQNFIVRGKNYEQKDKSIISYVRFEPFDKK